MSTGLTQVPDTSCEAGYYCETSNNDKFQYPCPKGHKCNPTINDKGLA